MSDLVVRPTLKFIHAAYAAEAVLIGAGFIVQHEAIQEGPAWAPLLLGVLVIWTIARHIRRLATKVTVSMDKLRYEVGMLSKSTRTIQLGKIQDVRVDQSLAQRILGVGTLAIETAGESSRLAIADIDRPQATADEIMRRSELATGATHQI
jgi:uncharacterized membrane protein YdbT with pleckstrin-like domain